MGLKELVDISREYGVNPDYVLAGGGNTSFKDPRTLHVKASGVPSRRPSTRRASSRSPANGWRSSRLARLQHRSGQARGRGEARSPGGAHRSGVGPPTIGGGVAPRRHRPPVHRAHPPAPRERDALWADRQGDGEAPLRERGRLRPLHRPGLHALPEGGGRAGKRASGRRAPVDDLPREPRGLRGWRVAGGGPADVPDADAEAPRAAAPIPDAAGCRLPRGRRRCSRPCACCSPARASR